MSNNKSDNNVKLVIQFSQSAEVNRIKRTIEKLSWFKENGYNVKVPAVLNKALDKGQILTDENIAEVVNDKYDSSYYEEKEAELLSEWEQFSEDFINKLRTLGLPLQNEYNVILTRYGVGGSYNLPKTIVIKLDNDKSIMDVVFHEIIHLTIEGLIKQYEIEHRTKERLVDLTFGRFFPNRAKLQVDPEKSEEVNKVFNNYFPDIEKIIIKISELR